MLITEPGPSYPTYTQTRSLIHLVSSLASSQCVLRPLLFRLVTDHLAVASEELEIGSVKFTTYDLGGHVQGTCWSIRFVTKN